VFIGKPFLAASGTGAAFFPAKYRSATVFEFVLTCVSPAKNWIAFPRIVYPVILVRNGKE